MVGVTVNRVNVLGTIHALLKCYTVYIIENTCVFGVVFTRRKSLPGGVAGHAEDRHDI